MQPAQMGKRIGLLLLLTFAALLIHGYHLGIEDQAIYLCGVHQNLNPSLYPHDAEFFLPQVRPTLIDELVALSVRATGLPVAAAVFAWHCLSVFLLLLACLRLARRCFAAERTAWAAVVFIAALLTLPVAGTALYLADQYLHPRTLATALLLLAIPEAVDRRWLRVAALLVPAALLHLQMTFFGVLFLAFLVAPLDFVRQSAATFIPLSSLFQPAPPAWTEATRTRTQHYLLRWQWYEWLGVVAPLVILWWFAHLADRTGDAAGRFRSLLCRRLVWFGAFCLAVGLAVTIPASLERLTPYQPMRGFHLVYLVLFLLIGGLIFEAVLRSRVLLFLPLLVAISAGMFIAQRDLFAGTRHIEWPGADTRNRWVHAFVWISENTPPEAFFAIDPRYMSAPGEDEHGFRALAKRSVLADWDKDAAVITLFPALAPEWQRQVHARDRYRQFSINDFRQLRNNFGANWLLSDHAVPGARCPYEREGLFICTIE